MSAVDEIREAAKVLRERAAAVRRPYGPQEHIDVALADWLDTAGADLWAHGPLCECGTGCDCCDDNLWEPHARHALKVARRILGERS